MLLGLASPAPKLHPTGETRSAEGAISVTALPWHWGMAPWLCDSPGTSHERWGMTFFGCTGLSGTALGRSLVRSSKCEETAQILEVKKQFEMNNVLVIFISF